MLTLSPVLPISYVWTHTFLNMESPLGHAIFLMFTICVIEENLYCQLDMIEVRVKARSYD